MCRPESKWSIAFIFAMAVLLFAGQISNAQTGTSSISGTVTDANGNVAVGATVTLSNPEKNFTRTQTTSDDGGYSFSAIPPDTYQIEVSAFPDLKRSC